MWRGGRGQASGVPGRYALDVGTNLLDTDAWSDEAVLAFYGEQSVAKPGFPCSKDSLFLISSVYVKPRHLIMGESYVRLPLLLFPDRHLLNDISDDLFA